MKLFKLGLKPVFEYLCLFISKDLVVFFYINDIAILYYPLKRNVYLAFRNALLAEYEIRQLGKME